MDNSTHESNNIPSKKELLKRPFLIASILVVIGLLMAGGFYVHSKLNSQIKLPKQIVAQLNFTALLPRTIGSGLSIDKSSYKYDTKEKVLSYVLYQDGVAVTITEQAYPETIIYDKFVISFGLYGEVQTKAGKLSLTRPANQQSRQVAVLNSNNQLLLFARAEKDLSDSQWEALANSLKPID